MAQVVLNGHPTYARVPRGTGEPVLLLHGGLSSSASIWRRLGPFLSRDFEVHAFDRRGHGRTGDTTEPFSYELMAEETAAYLSRVGRPAHLVGHSDGGNVALAVARRWPKLVSRVVTIGANFHFRGLVDMEPFTPESEGFEDFAKDFARFSPDGIAHAASVVGKSQRLIESEPTWNREYLADIESPVLVMVGDDDVVRLSHALEMYESLGDAQLSVIAGASHALMKERPHEVRIVVKRFLTMTLPVETLMPMRRISPYSKVIP